MRDEKPSRSELVAAAEAFDQELGQFGKLVEAARRCPLNSQKNIQRVAATFQQIGESEARLGAAAQALVAVIGAARERQQAQAASLEGRAQEILERTEIAAGLLRRYSALGEDAAQLNSTVQELAHRGREAAGMADPGLVGSLIELSKRMSVLAGGAQSLAEDSQQAGFDDIARQAHSLHQQVLAARNKICSLPSVERNLGQA